MGNLRTQRGAKTFTQHLASVGSSGCYKFESSGRVRASCGQSGEGGGSVRGPTKDLCGGCRGAAGDVRRKFL